MAGEEYRDNTVNMIIVITILVVIALPIVCYMIVMASSGDSISQDEALFDTEVLLRFMLQVAQVWAFVVTAYGVIRIGSILRSLELQSIT